MLGKRLARPIEVTFGATVRTDRCRKGTHIRSGLRPHGSMWGENARGRTDQPLGVFSQVTAGESHTCGLRNSGVVECWGDNYKGQAEPPLGQRFIQIDAGREHTCGVDSDHLVQCWGNLGHNQYSVPPTEFVKVSAGRDHTCGLEPDGVVECWGANGHNQSGRPYVNIPPPD